MTSPTDISWRKSSFSTGQNDCVEVARTPAAVLIRDSKNPASGNLTVTAHTWESLITSIRNGGLA
jgi:hypothetical protein